MWPKLYFTIHTHNYYTLQQQRKDESFQISEEDKQILAQIIERPTPGRHTRLALVSTQSV